MKSVENILGYIWEQFYRFSRGCKFKPKWLAWSCHYATRCFFAFLGDISTLKSGWNMKKLFCCPALELFHCLPLWKTILFVSSRAFSLSTPVGKHWGYMEKSYISVLYLILNAKAWRKVFQSSSPSKPTKEKGGCKNADFAHPGP